MTAAAHLPPGPRWPVALQGAAYIASRRRFMRALGNRYGTAYTVRLPFFGPIWRKETHFTLYPLATSAQERLRHNSILFDEIRPYENWGILPDFSFRSESEQVKHYDAAWK